MTTHYEDTLLLVSRELDEEAKERLLVYARALASRPKGISGKEAIEIARELNWDKDALAEIQKALEDFNHIDSEPEVNFE